ncbi:MutS-related protein [Pantoea sp. App145]|uniref:MutS-related protein n=1 Tax=Pantoea sp. App145 TaxID=3071567 RepID=UPI003A806FF0
MKTYLMYPDAEFIIDNEFYEGYTLLMKDLELQVLFDAMSDGDDFLEAVVKKAFSSPMTEVQEIEYRQAVLKDVIENQETVENMYETVVNCIMMEKEKLHYGLFGHYPSAVLHQSLTYTRFLLEHLRKLRATAEVNIDKFHSSGFRRLMKLLISELNEDYLSEIEKKLKEMTFKRGVSISAELGAGNKARKYILRKVIHPERWQWLHRIFNHERDFYTVTIAPRDDNGARALSDLQDQGIILIANAMAQATAHLLSFFNSLRAEIGFYIACLNLSKKLFSRNIHISLPVPIQKGERHLVFDSLYDTCLTLLSDENIVSNNLKTDNKSTLIITGANQGGKSTFLRSVGLAQLMMQIGMFVTAGYFSSDVSRRIFTHYKCEEDSTITSGKLDEELKRMSNIIDKLRYDDLVLFNESFSATNSREGAEIIRNIVTALTESNVKVLFVTHTSEFACEYFSENHNDTVFLSAQREQNGGRTYKIFPGEPQDTSYGEDLFNEIFFEEHLISKAG